MTQEDQVVFGNGYSLKYFKALFILFIPVSILEIFSQFALVTMKFFMSGDNESRFYSYPSVLAQMNVNWINLALIVLASGFIIVGKKKLFSLIFLLKYPLILIGQGVVLYLTLKDFPYNQSLVTSYLGSIVFFLFFYVPHLFYLYVRIK